MNFDLIHSDVCVWWTVQGVVNGVVKGLVSTSISKMTLEGPMIREPLSLYWNLENRQDIVDGLHKNTTSHPNRSCIRVE